MVYLKLIPKWYNFLLYVSYLNLFVTDSLSWLILKYAMIQV